MHEAILYEKLAASTVRCHVCAWRCTIRPGKYGLCRVRHNRDGTLEILNYGQVSSVAADPIEKKPLFHFHPATRVFSLGGWGCNFRCRHCQNWQISHQTEAEAVRDSQFISPQNAVGLALQHECAGMAWTYNEPCIWLEYTLDSARLAKEHKLYTVYVTNGFFTEEALDTMGPHLDVWRVDVKGFSDSLYQGLAKVVKWRKVLEIAARAQRKWGMHIEVVTNIIPTMNDDDSQLEAIASWIRDDLGPLTPWHVTRFQPHYQLQRLSPTPVSTLERARAIGQKAGLRFIYVGNVPGHSGENTICYSCGQLIVERVGYHTRVTGLRDSRCRFCDAELNFRM